MNEEKLELFDLRSNYFKVTNELFEHNFSAYEIAVYSYLCRLRNNNTNKCFPSLNKIAEKTGCSKRKVQDCISKLCEKDFIHKVNGYNTSNRYILLPVAPDNKRIIEEAMKSIPDDVAHDAIDVAHGAMGVAHGATGVWHDMPPKKTNIKKTNIKNTKLKKKTYGINENVLLLEDEYIKLKEQFKDYDKKIDDLSFYISSTGKKYKSHYMTILNWHRKNSEQKPKFKHPFL